jgi:hypothetical protein
MNERFFLAAWGVAEPYQERWHPNDAEVSRRGARSGAFSQKEAEASKEGFGGEGDFQYGR